MGRAQHQFYSLRELHQVPPLESSGTGPWALPGALLDLQHTGHQFKTVSFNSWKVDSSNAHIKEFSILFSVNTVVTSQDTVVGFNCAKLTLILSFQFNRKPAITRGSLPST